MTKQDVKKIQNEHGICYLDMYVAKAFAAEYQVPEIDVLAVLRRAEKIALQDEHGKGKFERARERAVDSLAIGCETETAASSAEILSRYELATAYAILVRRME